MKIILLSRTTLLIAATGGNKSLYRFKCGTTKIYIIPSHSFPDGSVAVFKRIIYRSDLQNLFTETPDAQIKIYDL